ncbi:hypothetical protein NLX83_37240 [Allokutzneria sp. A3M-2-11 16]|uniref:hypothetical protein n=1 Tax=Allokutzneria sp. A3M-2-11 16 TaxID=2962043 RepID=UPI0020B7604E|nr:hypothetical protein [Allokutzneria sp. A3M-2-11 16]MCP3804926.1 hypothetical protein [Allokutzneria sp. A3M-2-11 16]
MMYERLPEHVRHLVSQCAVQQAWEMSASKVIAPFLPSALPVPSSLIDRLGRIHVSAGGLAIDQKKVVPWKDIREIHTRPAFEVVTTSMIDKAVQRATFVLPPIPGARKGTDMVAGKAKEAVLSILKVALSGSSVSLQFDLPIRIVHRRRLRTHEMNPGLLSLAFLALPGVSDGLLSAAQSHGRSIIRHPATTTPGTDRAAEALRERVRGMTARLGTQPPPPELTAAPEPPTPEPPTRRTRNQYG